MKETGQNWKENGTDACPKKGLIHRLVMSALRVVVTAYVGICLLMVFTQRRLVYYPDREVKAVPSDAGMEYEDIVLVASDNVKSAGWYVPSEASRGTVLFCHGNGGNISHRLDTLRIYHNLGCSVLIFDYRGYGRSEGSPDEEGTYADAEAAWKYLVEERGASPDDIIIAGRSLGGAVASYLASRHTCRALIVESSFTSAADVGREFYPFLPISLICWFGYNTEEYVKGIDFPVLVVHSRDDELIPFRMGRRIFEAANEPKDFLEISGSHDAGFLVTGQNYIDGLERFLAKTVD